MRLWRIQKLYRAVGLVVFDVYTGALGVRRSAGVVDVLLVHCMLPKRCAVQRLAQLGLLPRHTISPIQFRISAFKVLLNVLFKEGMVEVLQRSEQREVISNLWLW